MDSGVRALSIGNRHRVEVWIDENTFCLSFTDDSMIGFSVSISNAEVLAHKTLRRCSINSIEQLMKEFMFLASKDKVKVTEDHQLLLEIERMDEDCCSLFKIRLPIKSTQRDSSKETIIEHKQAVKKEQAANEEEVEDPMKMLAQMRSKARGMRAREHLREANITPKEAVECARLPPLLKEKKRSQCQEDYVPQLIPVEAEQSPMGQKPIPKMAQKHIPQMAQKPIIQAQQVVLKEKMQNQVVQQMVRAMLREERAKIQVDRQEVERLEAEKRELRKLLAEKEKAEEYMKIQLQREIIKQCQLLIQQQKREQQDETRRWRAEMGLPDSDMEEDGFSSDDGDMGMGEEEQYEEDGPSSDDGDMGMGEEEQYEEDGPSSDDGDMGMGEEEQYEEDGPSSDDGDMGMGEEEQYEDDYDQDSDGY